VTRRPRSAGVAAVLLVLLAPGALWAWDREAHQAVALVAEARLRPDTRRAVAQLLEGRPMADVAMWPDEVRNTTHRDTYNWHFVNIPLTAAGYDARRDCRPAARGDCIVAALERLEVILADASRTAHRRREALMFLIHLVADLHQPLHVSNNDDVGGNRRAVGEIGGALNLHSAWDSGILRASGKTVADLVADANRQAPGIEATSGAGGRYADWTAEGWRIAAQVAYRQLDGDERITDQEREAAMALIAAQIARAGVRLAAVINRALVPPPSR